MSAGEWLARVKRTKVTLKAIGIGTFCPSNSFNPFFYSKLTVTLEHILKVIKMNKDSSHQGLCVCVYNL